MRQDPFSFEMAIDGGDAMSPADRKSGRPALSCRSVAGVMLQGSRGGRFSIWFTSNTPTASLPSV
jgi:hypothetical protein